VFTQLPVITTVLRVIAQSTLSRSGWSKDYKHEGPHYSLKGKFAGSKEKPIAIKDWLAVLVDVIFAARLTQFWILG